MDPIKVDFSGKGRAKELFIPPEKAVLKTIISVIIALLTAVIAYYFMLPPINLKALDFYYYIALILFAYMAATFVTSKAFARPEYLPYVKRRARIPVAIALVFVLILGGGYIAGATLFRAKSYSSIIQVTEKEFGTDESLAKITQISDFTQVPTIDALAAENLANKKLGDLSEWVSQFVIDSPYSTQICYKNMPTRILPLKYGDVFKWFNNHDKGIPAYLIVNMYTQEANAVIVEGGIKCSTSEYFNRKLARVLRFNYPNYMFGVPSLEINEKGEPFWVCERIDKTIGLLGGEDVIGVVMVDARTCETEYYSIDDVKSDNSPIKWVDQVYSAALLDKQYNYFGRYSGGFVNAFIGQTGVKITTQGYSYLTNDDNIWMYAGVTSATSDDSIIGFALINQRTKEAVFQKISGTTESGARLSAQGTVSDKGWTATNPLLLNINGQATYFMALKDSGEVVKSYAMVSVERVQDAARSPNDDDPDLVACLKSYENKLIDSGIKLNFDYEGKTSVEEPTTDTKTVTGKVSDIRSAVISGGTVYYIRLGNAAVYYSIAASASENVVILNKGDTVTITYKQADAKIIPASSLALKE